MFAHLNESSDLTAEQRLWLAVLERALDDALGNVICPHYPRFNLVIIQEEARKWLFSERRGVGTFHWICDHLGLEVDAVRKEFKRKEAAKCQRSTTVYFRAAIGLYTLPSVQ